MDGYLYRCKELHNLFRLFPNAGTESKGLLMFEIKDPNVDIPEEEIQKVLELVANGASGSDIYRAGIKNTNGVPVSERQARRYRAAAEDLLNKMDDQMFNRFVASDKYMPTLLIEDEETDYPPVIVPHTYNRSCIMDIEVNSPSFNRMGRYSHFLICTSFYPLDGDGPYTLTLNFEDRRDDRRLLWEVLNEMAKYTFVIGHNVKGYDINWLLTRVMFYGWEIPKRLFYYDTYQAARRIPIATKKGLGSLMDFFRYKDAEKTQIMPLNWDRISSNKPKDFYEALDQVVYHCENDVIGNRYIYDVLMQYDPKPSWGLWPK